MEEWIFDSPDQAGETYRQFMKDFYQGNKLIRGFVKIGTKTVDLGQVRAPVLNVYAETGSPRSTGLLHGARALCWNHRLYSALLSCRTYRYVCQRKGAAGFAPHNREVASRARLGAAEGVVRQNRHAPSEEPHLLVLMFFCRPLRPRTRSRTAVPALPKRSFPPTFQSYRTTNGSTA